MTFINSDLLFILLHIICIGHIVNFGYGGRSILDVFGKASECPNIGLRIGGGYISISEASVLHRLRLDTVVSYSVEV